MRTRRRIIRRTLGSLFVLSCVLTACLIEPPIQPPPPENPFSYLIDPTIQPRHTSLSGPDGDIPVVALQDEDGGQHDYVANEVVLLPRDQDQLDAFLARHQGLVVADYQDEEAVRMVVVRLNAASFPLHRFEDDANRIGMPGAHRFSNELAARLVALTIHEQRAGLRITTNDLFQFESTVMLGATERSGVHPFLDPAFDNPVAKTGVTRAWQFMQASSLLSPLPQVRVAILDGGYFLDSTGHSIPDANGASDLPHLPLQYDIHNDRPTISGTNPSRCTNGAACPWHGMGAASVATGTLNNGAYAAGTGGQVAIPVLFNMNVNIVQLLTAVQRAMNLEVKVINMSFGWSCNWWCRRGLDFTDFHVIMERAHNRGIVMVSGAGNTTTDVGDEPYYPCTLSYVLCVGALGTRTDAGHVHDNRAVFYSGYGSGVDLWAPTYIRAWYGRDASQPPGIDHFEGTSAATPYVSGVIAMMLSINPELGPAQVRQILLETAWTDSPDPKVGRYLNAFGAVRRAADHRLPADRFEPNENVGNATPLSAGRFEDLNLDRPNDLDLYRMTVTGPRNVTVSLSYPDGLGRMALPAFARDGTQSCAYVEQSAYGHALNALSATYRVGAGTFVFGVNGNSNPLPYHMEVAESTATVLIDQYDAAAPNDTRQTASYTFDGGYINATLHTLSDVDHYQVYSQGGFSTMVLSLSSYAVVETSDIPLTIELLNNEGAVTASNTSSSDCGSQARVDMPQGFHVVRVSGEGIGAYRLWIGSYAEQHPLIDMERLIYLILHPNEPIEFSLLDPEMWFAVNYLGDLGMDGLRLEAAGLHMRLFDEAGENLLAEGAEVEGLVGQELTMPAGTEPGLFLLHLGRTEAVLEGFTVPVITGRLTGLQGW